MEIGTSNIAAPERRTVTTVDLIVGYAFSLRNPCAYYERFPETELPPGLGLLGPHKPEMILMQICKEWAEFKNAQDAK